MDREAVRVTLAEGRACYWSRSRQALWRKGETSGQVQRLHELRIDCDADAILARVDTVGPGVCHEGYRSCFFRVLDEGGEARVTERKTFAPERVYGTEGKQ